MYLHQEEGAAEHSLLLQAELVAPIRKEAKVQDSEVEAEGEVVPEVTVEVIKLVTMELEGTSSNSMTKTEVAVHNMEIKTEVVVHNMEIKIEVVAHNMMIKTEKVPSLVVKIEATAEVVADLEDKSHITQVQKTTISDSKDSMKTKILKVTSREVDTDKEAKVDLVGKINNSRESRISMITSMIQLPGETQLKAAKESVKHKTRHKISEVTAEDRLSNLKISTHREVVVLKEVEGEMTLMKNLIV